jgi:hypothetical protein
MIRFILIFGFAVLLNGCAEHRGSAVAHLSQTSPGRYEVRLTSVEWVAGGPCNFPQWPHREFGTCWIYTDSTNGKVAADRVSLAYGSSDGFRGSQEGPLHGSVEFVDSKMRVDLQLPWFADGVHVDHYQKFALNGTYTIKTQ